MNKKLKSLVSACYQEQVEAVYNRLLTLGDGEEDSEDIMDRCQVESLNHISNQGGSYRMEEVCVEEIEFEDVWDLPMNLKTRVDQFRLRRVVY